MARLLWRGVASGREEFVVVELEQWGVVVGEAVRVGIINLLKKNIRFSVSLIC